MPTLTLRTTLLLLIPAGLTFLLLRRPAPINIAGTILLWIVWYVVATRSRAEMRNSPKAWLGAALMLIGAIVGVPSLLMCLARATTDDVMSPPDYRPLGFLALAVLSFFAGLFIYSSLQGPHSGN